MSHLQIIAELETVTEMQARVIKIMATRLAELGDTVTGRDEIAQADKAYRDAIGGDEWPDWAEKGGEDDIETTILDKDCSPAAVLGFAMIEGKKFKTSLSVPTIYKYIAKGLFLNLTQEELPRHGKKKHKYKKVKKNKSASRAPAGESIEQRPEEIDEREEFGHWEGDTVYSGKGKRKTTRALLTLTERKTRKEIIIAIPNRKAETVVKALDALERKLGARRFRAIFKSITFDNGTEFAAAEELERSCINKHLPRTKVYFCHPYSSWERGTNENTNGMIRRRFPKGTNFAAVTNAQITQAENWINNYPRKILGYKSSEIVFRECLRELGIAA